MEVCPSTVLNSDASENVAYNNPDFPAYVKKGQLSSYPDFRAVSHWPLLSLWLFRCTYRMSLYLYSFIPTTTFCKYLFCRKLFKSTATEYSFSLSETESIDSVAEFYSS